jgi:putative colanic acid biosynthesis acetyltransferase WcaF
MNEIEYPGSVALSIKAKRAVWNIVSVFLFRPFVTGLFRSWRIFLLRIFGAHIDKTCNVYASVRIWAPWNLEMHRGSCLGPDVICYNQAKIVIEEDVVVSQYAYLCTAGHDTNGMNRADGGLIISPIIIKKGAWIGTRAFIKMGVIVGENAIVGATASVYKDVPDNMIVGGNPAQEIKRR